MSQELQPIRPFRLIIAIPANETTIPCILPIYQRREQRFLENTIPIDPQHPFETNSQEMFSRWLLQKTRMPLTRVTSLAYRPNDYTNHGVLGSTEIGGPYEGRLTLYKDLNKIPAIGQLGVAVHELAHASSPFNMRTTKDYGSETNRLMAARNAISVANQSVKTGIFLNGYQHALYQLLRKGEISPGRWYEENHAIAMELAATNPRHLQQIEVAQYFTLLQQRRAYDFVRLTSKFNPKTNEQIVSGTDQALMHLTHLPTVAKLYKHWEQLRGTLKGELTPLHLPRLRRPVTIPKTAQLALHT